MSCHLSHRLTTVHRAVSMALLCSISYAAILSTAQAATIGKTVVTSAQHEPLAATIMVTDIRAADFSASLANTNVYQQMGLSPTDSMTVRFKPTSATSGQVFITTAQPVSKPFADVVLAINDKGQRNVIPKTLLMPLRDSLPIDTTKNIVTGAKKPNLPSVSTSIAQPLTVRKGAPPPLISAPKISAPQSSATELMTTKLPTPNIQAPTVTTTLQSNTLSYTPSRLDNGRLKADTSSSVMTAGSSDSKVSKENTNENNAGNVAPITTSDQSSTAPNTDKQLDILNIQVIRQIQPRGKADAAIAAQPPFMPAPSKDIVATSSAKPDVNTHASASGANSTMTTSTPSSNTSADTVPSTSPKADASAAAQYQVQRNDSLWVIAQQIAQENNLEIQTVMKQIQTQNPDAFINKDADQLKADAKLRLPSYDVVPSQQKLEAAISAQRQYSRRANTPAIKKTPKTPATATQATNRPKKPKITKTQTLPQAQFSVLAPGRNGSADGTQAKSAAATGSGLSTDILATLKASRQSTAEQAQQLSKTNSALDSYTKKIQLQNQKLAELQARLKKLRNQ